MKEHWQKIVIGILIIVLSTIAFDYAVRDAKYEVLQSKHEQTTQTLTRQTRLIVELRQKLMPRNFESFDELSKWVSNWEVENKPIAVSIINHTFVIGGNTELYSHYWDCDDITEAMQRDALKDGYLMSAALIDGKGNICDTKVSNLVYHTGCMTIAENTYYFIEPQTGEIVMIVRRD